MRINSGTVRDSRPQQL